MCLCDCACEYAMHVNVHTVCVCVFLYACTHVRGTHVTEASPATAWHHYCCHTNHDGFHQGHEPLHNPVTVLLLKGKLQMALHLPATHWPVLTHISSTDLPFWEICIPSHSNLALMQSKYSVKERNSHLLGEKKNLHFPASTSICVCIYVCCCVWVWMNLPECLRLDSHLKKLMFRTSF